MYSVAAALLKLAAGALAVVSPVVAEPPWQSVYSNSHVCECAGECDFHIRSGFPTTRPWCLTTARCGFHSAYGDWKWCDARGVERRRADDGKFYNELEFDTYYGRAGSLKWRQAEPFREMRTAKDNQVYTASAFSHQSVKLGLGQDAWVEEWAAAKPERRQGDDGNLHPWDWYVEHYGPIGAWKKWYIRSAVKASSKHGPIAACHASALNTYLDRSLQDRRQLRGSAW